MAVGVISLFFTYYHIIIEEMYVRSVFNVKSNFTGTIHGLKIMLADTDKQGYHTLATSF